MGEIEVTSHYLNYEAALLLRIVLEEMGHPQPETPVIVDNATAQGSMKGTMTPKKANEHDMRAAWLKCRQARRQFNLIWEPGKTNKTDYH